MARYMGPMIDGGGDDVSVGKLDKKTAKIVANDQAKDPTILLNQLMRRYKELESLEENLNAAKVDAKLLDTKADELEDYAAQARKDAVDAQKNANAAKELADIAVAAANEAVAKAKAVKTITSQGFEGECAYRKYVTRYSDGSVDSRPAPEDCGDGLGTSTIENPVSTSTPEIKTEATPAKVSIPAVIPPPPKTAPIDTILFDDESVPIEIMSDMIFEDIGGHEIINIARNDTVNGQTVSYQPIKNLTSIQQQYNPNNIVALQDTSQKYFENFSIKLETKLPAEDGGGGPDGAYVYIEQSTGDLIVELINLEPDEQIEVEIKVSGTIYEAEFNES